MPPGFTASLAARLDADSALTVREARAHDEISPDTALIAPAGHHLEVVGPRRVRLSDDPPIGALRPRADVTYASAAKAYGGKILCVVLTGMGNDGEAGIREVKRKGGRVLAEDESTCVVYGMPRAVTEAGLTDAVFPLDAMAIAIVEAVAQSR
jgi:two-component system chemotaxis response regulator CheB